VAGTREGVSVRPGTLERLIESYKDDPETLHNILGDDPHELSSIMENWILSDNPELRFIPTDSIVFTIDKEAVRKSGIMYNSDEIPDRMEISLKDRKYITKNHALVLEMIAQSNFSRPIYFTIGSGQDSYGELYHYFVQEGLLWRVTPFYFKENKLEYRVLSTVCDTEKMYRNMMEKYRYGNVSQPGIYIDETTGRMCASHRRCFAKLATQLCQEHKYEKALQVLERSEKEIPTYNLPHSYISGSLDMVDAYQLCGKTEKATNIYQQLEKTYKEYQIWRKEN
jgi:hypothetical protein